MTSLSKSQVSELARELDQTVSEFCNRPLDAGPYTYAWADALVVKCREGGRVVNVALLVAVEVNNDQHLGNTRLRHRYGRGRCRPAGLFGAVSSQGDCPVYSSVCSDDHASLRDAVVLFRRASGWIGAARSGTRLPVLGWASSAIWVPGRLLTMWANPQSGPVAPASPRRPACRSRSRPVAFNECGDGGMFATSPDLRRCDHSHGYFHIVSGGTSTFHGRTGGVWSNDSG